MARNVTDYIQNGNANGLNIIPVLLIAVVSADIIGLYFYINKSRENRSLKEYSKLKEYVQPLIERNAYHATMGSDADSRNVTFTLDNSDKTKITVSNSYFTDSAIDFSKWFTNGYSQKGENRARGLSNVKKIVKKYNGKIEVAYHDNTVTISIIF